jgi:hypothetical protein
LLLRAASFDHLVRAAEERERTSASQSASQDARMSVPAGSIAAMPPRRSKHFVSSPSCHLTLGDLEKSISLLIETGRNVNASESNREQSGIIRRQFCGIKRQRQFFEVPFSLNAGVHRPLALTMQLHVP